MSIDDLKPMKYSDVGKGYFDKMLQESFLKAHKLASEYNQRVEVVAKITIFPPDPMMPSTGNHSFEVQVKEPKYVSTRFTTSLFGGLPISDGKNLSEASQVNLFNQRVDVQEVDNESID